VTACAVRRKRLGPASLFEMPERGAPVYHGAMLGALAVGVIAAFVATALSSSILITEEWFEKIPIHWMWYPAIGGLGVGLGGLIFPRALGVGYSVIQQMIAADSVGWKFIAGVLVVKSAIWIFSLGSNTAGGILAPLLMIGGALGAALGHFMPLGMTNGAWVVVGMTSVLSAAIGAPLTSAMLAMELTHNGGLMLPVLLSCVASYAVSVLVMSRSLLTAGLSARGLHLSREFGVDPLETMLVSQAMHTSVFALPDNATRKDAADWLRKMDERGGEAWSHWQRIFPLVDSEGRMKGVLTRSQMIRSAKMPDQETSLAQDGMKSPQAMTPGTTLRNAAALMAESKLTSYPVVDAGKFVGVLTIDDLLKGRSEQTHRESDRERVLRLRWPFGTGETLQQHLDKGATLTAAEEDEQEKY
jgi:CIC family chloride channel protein